MSKAMKTLALLAMLMLPLAAGEGVTDVKLANITMGVPWSCTGLLYDDSATSEEDAQYLRELTQEGVFELLRKDLYPQMEASLEVSDDQHIRLDIRKAEMIDVIVYCNLCRIYAELLKPKKEVSYIQQLGEEQRKQLLLRLRTTLNDLLRAPQAPASAAETAPGEDVPPFVAIRDLRWQEVELFVADKWLTDSEGGREQRYRWFCVPLLLVPWESECEQYQILREVKPELTFSQVIFETRLLAPSIGAQVLGVSPDGCEYATLDYSLEDIRKKERDIVSSQPES